jgi:hypothetical protein
MRLKKTDKETDKEMGKARRPNRVERELHAEMERKISDLSGRHVTFVRPRGRRPQREVFTDQPSLFELDHSGKALYECVGKVKACCRPVADWKWNEIVKCRQRSYRAMRGRRSVADKRQKASDRMTPPPGPGQPF